MRKINLLLLVSGLSACRPDTSGLWGTDGPLDTADVRDAIADSAPDAGLDGQPDVWKDGPRDSQPDAPDAGLDGSSDGMSDGQADGLADASIDGSLVDASPDAGPDGPADGPEPDSPWPDGPLPDSQESDGPGPDGELADSGADASLSDVGPDACLSAQEICNGVDDNCNLQIDEDLGQTICGIGACRVEVQSCVDGEPQVCVPANPGPAEDCSTAEDDNCNGDALEGCPFCSGANLVQNPGFETAPGPEWSLITTMPAVAVLSQDCDQSQAGDCSGKITIDQAGNQDDIWLEQTLSLTATFWEICVFLRADTPKHIFLTVYVGSSEVTLWSADVEGWRGNCATISTGGGIHYLRIRVDDGTTADVWVDTVSVRSCN